MAIVDNSLKLDFKEFAIQIFVVGGKNGNGEGILILFLRGTEVIRTITMDCCTTVINGTECNLIAKLLMHFHVKKIDCFVWTHPHDDHSCGFESLVDTFYRKGSIGVIPKQIYGTDNDVVNMRPMSKKVLKKMNFKFDKKNLKSIDCQPKEKRCVYSFCLEDSLTGQTKNVNLYCLTPIDFMLDDKRRKQKKISDSLLNEISLSMILDVDGYSFFFGGDAPDKSLKESEKYSLYGCKWIKIPHHASKTAQNIIQLFNNEVDSAVTTSFLTQQLPNKGILDKYKNVTKQNYVTQKTKEDASAFGMIGYRYTFINSSVQLKITRYGNAYKYE